MGTDSRVHTTTEIVFVLFLPRSLQSAFHLELAETY